MCAEQTESGDSPLSARLLLLGAVLVVGGGWFMLSWRVMGSDVGLAANEAVGAALGVLLFVAVVGTVRKR